MKTSKNSQRHAELDSASPCYQGIADHVRNDVSVRGLRIMSAMTCVILFLEVP